MLSVNGRWRSIDEKPEPMTAYIRVICDNTGAIGYAAISEYSKPMAIFGDVYSSNPARNGQYPATIIGHAGEPPHGVFADGEGEGSPSPSDA
jgi:hypothetical protein